MKYYKATYAHNIAAIADHQQWPDMPHILPPPLKRGVGKPSRNSRRGEGEQAKGKRAKTIRCKIFGAFGHNKRTCKGGATAKETAANAQASTSASTGKRVAATTGGKVNKKAKQTQIVLSQTESQPASLSQISTQ